MNPVTPTRVIGGRYVVLGELGRGGMGIVWRAEDRVMGRQVAVKELHLPAGLSPDEHSLFRDRLLREARTAGRLSDPAIVTVYDVITDSGVDHIVMELIEARTLTDIVAAHGPLPERTVVALAQQLVSALQAAHAGGVVHRDVKPSNVMLAADGRAKLTDFGIAQAADDPRLTATGAVVGSPGYLSPERLSGGAATPAADMWALGATLHLALTGRAPFARDTTAATIAAVLHAEVPSVHTRSALGTVIDGLLQRPTARRLSGQQVIGLLGGAPRTSDGTTVVGRPARRRRWWRPVLLVVTGLVVGLAGGYLAGTHRDPGVAAYTYGTGAQVPVFEATSTGCLAGRIEAGHSVPSDDSVSCTGPHESEIFATLQPFDSSTTMAYPGADRLAAYARGACDVVFGSELVTGADKAGLQVVALVPGETSFGTQTSSGTFGDRTVACVLQSRDGAQLTGARLRDG